MSIRQSRQGGVLQLAVDRPERRAREAFSAFLQKRKPVFADAGSP